jgi:GDP-mannose pyrophosphatase NudK
VATNPAVEVLNTEVLSDNWYMLRKVTFRLRKRDGTWETQSREAYDRGNGATILPYDPSRRTVILTRQFRLPTFVNGNASGMLIETCAGLLDSENPWQCITRELREETGFEIHNVRKVMEAYMSPGSVTEILHFFVAEYTPAQRASAGGGVEEEDIEVLELTIDEAEAKIATGEIRDGKTSCCCSTQRCISSLQRGPRKPHLPGSIAADNDVVMPAAEFNVFQLQ